MPNKAKKMAVLDCLRAADAPQGLPDILALLPPGFAERSVRRWLAELADEGAVVKSGLKRGTRYRAAAPTASGAATSAPAREVPDDATVEAVYFDAVRVRYRRERRTAIAEIVSQALIGSPLTARVEAAAEDIPTADRVDFVQDLHEDLALLSPARIAGMGITLTQLRGWLAAKNRD